MARFPYGRLRNTASRLIGNAGQPGAIRRMVPTQATKWDDPVLTPVDYPCTFVEAAYSAFEIDGTLIRSEDRKLVVSPSVAITPTPEDRFVIGSEVLEIVRVTPTSPGGIALLFTIQARK